MLVALCAVGAAAETGSGSGSGSGSDPMPPEDADAGAKLDPKNILTLTDDPILGKAHAIAGEEHPGLVAFTFDDGPNPDTSPTVIDALDKYDIPATFFIVTQNIAGKSKHAEASRAVLARELASGFTIGSHSVTHPNLKTAEGDTLDREIDASIKTLAMTAHRPIGLFRPPYGSLSGAGRMRLKKLGLTEVQWSIDTLDWKARDAERLRKKVLKMILDAERRRRAHARPREDHVADHRERARRPRGRELPPPRRRQGADLAGVAPLLPRGRQDRARHPRRGRGADDRLQGRPARPLSCAR